MPGWEAVRERPLFGAGESREFVLGLVEVQRSGRIPLHSHRHAEIDYVVAGTALVRVGNNVDEVGPGTCIYFAPESARALAVVGPDPFCYLRTFACERVPPPVEPCAPIDDLASTPPLIGAERDVPWRSVEASKGMRIRVKRLVEGVAEAMAGIGDLDPGVHYTRHYHDQPELYFVLAGSGVLHGTDSETDVGPGCAVYLRSREVHGVDSVGDVPLRLYWVYGCETAGHQVNWTAVEPIYADARPRLAAR
jgi:mannose-6-phosphate isomerase-like protein (cupin superfamily)